MCTFMELFCFTLDCEGMELQGSCWPILSEACLILTSPVHSYPWYHLLVQRSKTVSEVSKYRLLTEFLVTHPNITLPDRTMSVNLECVRYREETACVYGCILHDSHPGQIVNGMVPYIHSQQAHKLHESIRSDYEFCISGPGSLGSGTWLPRSSNSDHPQHKPTF